MIASGRRGATSQSSIDRNIPNTNPNMDSFQRAKRPRVQRHLLEVDGYDVEKTRDGLCKFVASVPKLFPSCCSRSDNTLEKVISYQTKTTVLQPMEVFPKKRRNRDDGRVTFATPLVSAYIPHVLHDDDIDSNWYSRRELEQIDENCMETIRLIQSGKLIYDDDHEYCKRGLESRISQQQLLLQTAGRHQNHQVYEQECSLVSKSSSTKSKEDIISAVLDAQIDMWSSGITSRNDEEYQLEQFLSDTYKTLSSHHGFKAIVRGLHDWRAVVHDYDDFHDSNAVVWSDLNNVNRRTSTTASLMNEISRIASASAASAAATVNRQPSSIFV